jgi:hypothetical protein
MAAVPELPRWPSQRTPADFKIQRIKAERELRRDPTYVAEFANVPLRTIELEVPLDGDEYAQLQRLKRGDLYGDDDGAALRDILFSWWEERFIRRPPERA